VSTIEANSTLPPARIYALTPVVSALRGYIHDREQQPRPVAAAPPGAESSTFTLFQLGDGLPVISSLTTALRD
jgi:hypothetical protein